MKTICTATSNKVWLHSKGRNILRSYVINADLTTSLPCVWIVLNTDTSLTFCNRWSKCCTIHLLAVVVIILGIGGKEPRSLEDTSRSFRYDQGNEHSTRKPAFAIKRLVNLCDYFVCSGSIIPEKVVCGSQRQLISTVVGSMYYYLRISSHDKFFAVLFRMRYL